MSSSNHHVLLEPPPGAARLILAAHLDAKVLVVDLCGRVIEGRLGGMGRLDLLVFSPLDGEEPPLPQDETVYVEFRSDVLRTAFYTRAMHCGPGSWVLDTPTRIQCWEERRAA